MNLDFVNSIHLLHQKLNQSLVVSSLNRVWGEKFNRESVSVPGVVLRLSCPYLDPTSPATEQQRSKHQCVWDWNRACRESCVWNIPVCSAVCAGRERSVWSAAVTCCWWREPSLWPPGCLLAGPVVGCVRRSPAGSSRPSHETVSPAEQPVNRQQLNSYCYYIKIWIKKFSWCFHQVYYFLWGHFQIFYKNSRICQQTHTLLYLECVSMLLQDVEVSVYVMDVDHVALAFCFS